VNGVKFRKNLVREIHTNLAKRIREKEARMAERIMRIILHVQYITQWLS